MFAQRTCKRPLIALACVFAIASPEIVGAEPDAVDHSAWDRLLKTYVRPSADGITRVNYASFKARDHSALKHYLGDLQSINPNRLDRNEQFAFYVNLYNAKTIDIVLDHYPVASIKKILLGGGLFAALSGGPWKAKVVKVNGTALSLDDIEHGILRKSFKDPRVHYAVNCASIGCPNLATKAYTGANLDAQLDAGARSYVNHPRGLRVEGRSVVASSIYDWFKEDFGGTDQGVIRHAQNYTDPALAKRLTAAKSIGSFEYDWSLNDTKR